MRLRTIEGTRWPAKCADGCGTVIPADPAIKVVVDFDARPRKTWLASHSPDAATWGGKRRSDPAPAPQSRYEGVQASYRTAPTPSAAASSRPAAAPPSAPGNERREEASTPARASSSPPPKAVTAARSPEPPRSAPSPPEAEADKNEGATGSSPTSARAWASGQLSLRESSLGFCRVAFAAHALEGESDADLRGRVSRALLADLETQVAALRAVRARVGYEPSPARRRDPVEMEP